MFDTYRIGSTSTQYVPYEKSVTVTEKRATTDESVKLLNEFQEKAKQNLVDQIKIEDNTLNGVVLFFKQDIVHDKVQWFGKFSLNGKEHKLQGELPFGFNEKISFHLQWNLLNIPDLREVFVAEIAKALMIELMKGEASKIKDRIFR